jgi:cation-transporting ATPase 13A3/4/5
VRRVHVCGVDRLIAVDPGIFPKSATRAPVLPGSRRASIASRRSSSYSRPYGHFGRASSSQVDLLYSPPPANVFVADSEDESPTEERRPLPRAGSSHQPSVSSPRARRESRRGRTASNAQEGFFSFRDTFPDQGRTGAEEDGDDVAASLISTSPARPSTALGKLVSYIGFARSEAGDEEAGMVRRSSRSRSRSRRGSFDSGDSGRRSPCPSSSGWGLSDEDDEEYSDRAEGEEGYTSSLADDTSLPPQSRPGSPSLPLVPNPGDGIFGEPSARHDFAEPKDFASTTIPSRQTVLLPDEDLSIRFTCYRTDPFHNVLWWAGCILTLGALGLLGRWVPSIWVNFCGQETAFDEAREGSWLVVEVGSYCHWS